MLKVRIVDKERERKQRSGSCHWGEKLAIIKPHIDHWLLLPSWAASPGLRMLQMLRATPMVAAQFGGIAMVPPSAPSSPYLRVPRPAWW